MLHRDICGTNVKSFPVRSRLSFGRCFRLWWTALAVWTPKLPSAFMALLPTQSIRSNESMITIDAKAK